MVTATICHPSRRWQRHLSASKRSLLRRSQTPPAAMLSLFTSTDSSRPSLWMTSSLTMKSMIGGPSPDPAMMMETVQQRFGRLSLKKPGLRSLVAISASSLVLQARQCTLCLACPLRFSFTIACASQKNFGIRSLMPTSVTTRWRPLSSQRLRMT